MVSSSLYFAVAEEHFHGVPLLFLRGDRRALVECTVIARCFLEALTDLAPPASFAAQASQTLQQLDVLATSPLTATSQHHAYELLSWLRDWTQYLRQTQIPLHPTFA